MKLLLLGGGGIAAGIATTWPHESVTLDSSACDVRHDIDVKRVLTKHEPDAVVNCAGVSYPGPLSTGQYREELETNLLGSFNIAARAAPATRLVFIGSVAGLYGKPGHAGYSASKAGVRTLVQALAEEGRQAWAVSPGRVDTPMRERDYPDDTPGSRLRPEQLGHLVTDILLHNAYPPGTNVVILKRGLRTVITFEDRGDGWREFLRVGSPKTI